MSSKIFPPRLVPSADDPLREDREAEVDASSVVCLVFVASRSSIVVDAFFFSKFYPANTKGGALFLCGSTRPFSHKIFPPTHPLFPALPHNKATTNKSFAQRKKKKRLNSKSREKRKKRLLVPHARAREHTESTLTRTYARNREGLADGVLQRVLVLSR